MDTERIEHLVWTTYVIGLFVTPMVVWAAWFVKHVLDDNVPSLSDFLDDTFDEDGVPMLLTFIVTLLWPIAAAFAIGFGLLWLMSFLGMAIAMWVWHAIVSMRRKHDEDDDRGTKAH